MNKEEINRTRRVGEQFESPREGRALILMYHRVAELASDPWSLCVTPQHFAQHLEVIRKHGNPVQTRQLMKALQDGDTPALSLVVTFDDGYADNLYDAKPLLERYDIPATVFVTTGHLGQEREFWWDELERILLQSGELPEELHLSMRGSDYTWKLEDAAHETGYACTRHRDWRAWNEAPSSRHSLYRSLWQLLQPLPECERRNALTNLLFWANAEPQIRPTHRTLSFQEVLALAEGSLVEIGSHTMTHPDLSVHPPAAQRDEIQRSKAILEELLERPVASFAYPFGGPDNYTAETVAIVRQAGYACACSSTAGAISLNNNRYQLPRVQVVDWDGEEFAKWLFSWKTAAGLAKDGQQALRDKPRG